MPANAKTYGIAAAVLALLAGAAWLVEYETSGRYSQDTDDAVIAADQVTISAKLSGYVRSVAVADNQAVKQGEPLLEIDPTDYATRLASAKADVGSALAATRSATAQQAEAVAGVATAKIDADLAAREVERYAPLARSGAEPAEKLAQLTATRDRAVAALAQARARVASIAAQGAQLAARGDAARVAEAAAGNDLAATHLSAPIAGRIASRAVRVGQFVQPGMRLLTIVPSGEAYVLANFKETQVGLMRPGQPAELRVDALPGVHFSGVVESITPGTGANFSLIPPQNATGNFTKIVQRVPVRIRILAGPVARAALVPGLSVSATVDTKANAGEMDAIRAEAERAHQ
jgi:membrane fusion protein (multidrug efflux system)